MQPCCTLIIIFLHLSRNDLRSLVKLTIDAKVPLVDILFNLRHMHHPALALSCHFARGPQGLGILRLLSTLEMYRIRALKGASSMEDQCLLHTETQLHVGICNYCNKDFEVSFV